MTKRRTVLLLLVCGVMGMVILAVLTRSREPSYQGRPLSDWLTIYYESDRPDRDRTQRPVAAGAIQGIGTNALPYLLESIRYEAPSWHRDVARVLPLGIGNSRPARATLYRGFHRAEAARQGFRLLGSNAVSAIPKLWSMMKDESRPGAALRALEALSYLGPEGFHVMAAGLADTHQPFRADIVAYMATITAHSVGTNICLPPLRAAMNDPDPQVRFAASNMVRRLTWP